MLKRFVFLIFILYEFSLVGCSSNPSNASPFRSVLSINNIRYADMMKQEMDWSCGVASLATILKYGLGDSKINEISLIQTIQKNLTQQEIAASEKAGLSMKQLASAANSLGYDVMAKNLNAEQLAALNIPAIIKIEHLDGAHFVIVKGIFTTTRMKYALFVDPASGNLRMPYYQLVQSWLGDKNQAPVLIVQRKDRLWVENSPLLIN